MRTLNVRLVLGLLIAAVVVIGAIEGLRRFQVWRKADFFITQAESTIRRAEAVGDVGEAEEELELYDQAAKDFSWYLRLRSGDADVSERLGLLQYDLFMMTNSLAAPMVASRERDEMLQKARDYLEHSKNRLEAVVREDRDSTRTTARRKLVDIYMLMRDYTDAKTHLMALLRKYPNNAELLELRGRCQANAREEMDAATESFRLAIENDPHRIDAYLHQAALLAAPDRLNRMPEADLCMNRMLETNLQSHQAHLAYGGHMVKLTSIRSIDEAGKRPILLDAMVPFVLSRAIDKAMEEASLAADDPDAGTLVEGKPFLTRMVLDAMEIYDPNLALDNPLALLMSARRGDPKPLDIDAVGRAATQATAALRSDENINDPDVLSIAEKHSILVHALPLAIETFSNPTELTATIREGMLTRAAMHVQKARKLAAQDRLALMSLAVRDISPEDSKAIRVALDKGILHDSLQAALESEPLDQEGVISEAFLRRVGAKPFLMDALEATIKKSDLPDEERQSLMERRVVLVDVLRHALRANEQGAADSDQPSDSPNAEELIRWVDEAIFSEQGLLSRAARRLTEETHETPYTPWSTTRESLVEALTHTLGTLDVSDEERDCLSGAIQSGALVDSLQQLITDSEVVISGQNNNEASEINRVLYRAVRRVLNTTERKVELSDSRALLVAAQCALMQQNPELAMEFMEQGIQAYPAEAQMYLTLAQIEAQYGDPEKSLTAIDRGLRATDAPSLIWAKAVKLLDLGRIREARAVTRTLQQHKYPEASVGHLQARSEYALGHSALALNGRPRKSLFRVGKEYEVDLDKDSVSPALRAEFRKREIQLSETPDLSYEGNNLWVLVDREAVYDIRQEGQGYQVSREASLGFTQIRGALAGTPDLSKEADFLTGRCYAQLNNVDQEIRAYRRALDTDPYYVRARMALGEALLRSGRHDDALREYQQLVDLGVNDEGNSLLMAQLVFEKNRQRSLEERNWQEVEQILGQIEASGQITTQVILLRMRLLVARSVEQMELADRATSNIDRQLSVNRSETLLTEADRLLERALIQNPQEVELWSARIQLAGRGENWGLVELLLDNAEEEVGDNVTLRVARANYVATRHGAEAREEIREMADDVGSLSEEEQLRYWNALLSIVQRTGDQEYVRTLCNRIAERAPNNLQVRELLLRIAFQSRDDASIAEVLTEIEAVEGKGPTWLYGEAVRLGMQCDSPDDPRLDRALELLAQARELRPSWGQIPLAAASIYTQKGNLSEALESYILAIDLGEYSISTVRNAVELLNREQRFTEALTLLDIFEQIPAELLRAAGWADYGLGRFDDALDKAKQMAADSESYRDHGWLGQLLYESGRRALQEGMIDDAQDAFTEAEASLRKAVELADGIPESWITLVHFLANTGQTRKAEDAVAEARAKIPAEQRSLALAKCYEAMGRNELAEKSYEEALAASLDDPAIAREVVTFYLRRSESAQTEPGMQSDSRVRAEDLLKQIINRQVKSTEADVHWARRQRALILLTRGDYPSQQSALKLIEQNLAEAKSSTEDLRYKASILANDPSPERRDEATRILENLPGSRRAASPEVAFTLWQLYLAQGNWTKANAQMTSLLATHADKPQYVAAYAAALLNRKQPEAAVPWLNQLDKIAPQSYLSTSLRAEWHFLSRRYDEAYDLMNDYVGTATAEPADEAERSRLMAQLMSSFAERLQDLGEEDMANRYLYDAETLCWKYIQARSGQEWFMAFFLAEQNRIEDSLQLLESSWRDSDPAAVAVVTTTLLNNPATNSQQTESLVTLLQSALDQFDRPVPLLLVMARARTLQGQYNEAEEIYREVIRENDDSFQAMNNLAVLLALRNVKLPEALKLINQAIKMAGPIAALLDSRASVYIAMDQPDKALADLDRAILSETTPVRSFHRARAYQVKGEKRQAIEAMQEALGAGLDETMIEPLEKPAYETLRKMAE